MTPLDMVHTALQELGEDASSGEVSEFIRQRFGLEVGAQFIPIYRATIRGEEQLRQAREMAAKVVADEVERPMKRIRTRAGRGDERSVEVETSD